MSNEEYEDMQDDERIDDEEMVDYDEEIKKVQQKLEKNPDKEELIDKLFELFAKNGDFEELETMRNEISQRIPLSLKSYSNWIKQKQDDKNIAEAKKVLQLALSDYNNTSLWFMWIEAHEDDPPEVRRNVYEQALNEVRYRLDIADGFWECYLQFEKSVNNDPERINSLYMRALSVPYLKLFELWNDYKEYCASISQAPSAEVEKTFLASKEQLTKIVGHEKAFEKDPAGYAETYLNYITELKDPAQIQALYERIIDSDPKDEASWSSYCSWCEIDLKVQSVALSVYKRAIRHIPYNPYLWQGLLNCAERAHEDPKQVDTFWESAKQTISDVQSGLCLYRTYIYMLRRRAAAGDKNYEHVNKMFAEGQRVLEEYFEHAWDPEGVYRRNYAYFSASVMGNMEQARKLWQDILASGGGRLAEKWLEAVRLERQFGDVQHARKLLYRALNSVADNPTVIYDYFIQFEREEGTFEELDLALEKVNAQQKHRSHRPQKQQKEKEKDKSKNQQQGKKRGGNETGGPPPKISIPKTKEIAQVKKETQPSTPPVIKDKDGFTMPLPMTAPRKSKTPEPLPRKAEKEKLPQAETSKKNVEKPETSKKSTEKPAEGQWTVFCSNIDFRVTAEDIKSALDGVVDVRLAVRPGQKQHKGFAYVDLDSEKHYREALTKDREITLGQRKMFISVNDPGNRVGFKYSTGKEESKIFVRNVHFDCTEEQLKDFFSQFGPVANVRIVTHKNGKAKGVAYVDFENVESANKAVNAEDLTLLDRKITVAISNPPSRDSSSSQSSAQQSATSETSRRSHIQIVPRSVVKKSSSSNGSTTGKPLSNDEFRKKFLGMMNRAGPANGDAPVMSEEYLTAPYQYIRDHPGKHVRARMAEAFNTWLQIPADKFTTICEIVEMLHNASLMVDDIEDNSVMRRGVPVTHSVYGIPRTINSANYIYFRALEKCNSLQHPHAVIIFTEQMLEMHRGQGKELYWRDCVVCPTEIEYEMMVEQKTGGLFILAAKLMQLFTTHDFKLETICRLLAKFFQIRDDYLNLTSDEMAKAKTFAEDLTEGKFSFPIIHAVRNSPAVDANDDAVLNILRQRTNSVEVKQYCIQEIRRRGSLAYTEQRLEALTKEVSMEVMTLGGNAALIELVANLATGLFH